MFLYNQTIPLQDVKDWSLEHEPTGKLFQPIQNRSDWVQYRLNQEAIETFWRDGYLNHLPLLSHDQCDAILEEYGVFMSESGPNEAQLDLIYEFHRNQSGDVNNVLMHALGHWRLSPLFHDLVFLPSAVIHIALEDQTEENGTLQYIPGSHRWTRNGGPLPVVDYNFKDMESIKTILTEEELAQFKPVKTMLKKGEASIHHPLSVHGSYENRSNQPRRSAVLNYFADGTRSGIDDALLKGSVVPKGQELGGQLYPLVYDPAWCATQN